MTRAIILAAGRGSRLHPYTENAPKCQTVLNGKSLIDRQIDTLRGAGIDDIVLATGYLAEKLAHLDLRRIHNPDWANTNMVETLFNCDAEFGEDLLVCYSDIVYEPRVLTALLETSNELSVAVNTDWRAFWELRFENPLEDAESLRLGEDGRILDIGSPVERIEEIEGQFMGLMRFCGNGIERLRKAKKSLDHAERDWKQIRPARKAYMTDLLMELVLMGNSVFAEKVHGGWLEIDTVEDYEKIRIGFKDGSIRRFLDLDAIDLAVGQTD